MAPKVRPWSLATKKQLFFSTTRNSLPRKAWSHSLLRKWCISHETRNHCWHVSPTSTGVMVCSAHWYISCVDQDDCLASEGCSVDNFFNELNKWAAISTAQESCHAQDNLFQPVDFLEPTFQYAPSWQDQYWKENSDAFLMLLAIRDNWYFRSMISTSLWLSVSSESLRLAESSHFQDLPQKEPRKYRVFVVVVIVVFSLFNTRQHYKRGEQPILLHLNICVYTSYYM